MPFSVISMPVNMCCVLGLELTRCPTGMVSAPGMSATRSTPRSIFSQVKPSSRRSFRRSPYIFGSFDSVVSA